MGPCSSSPNQQSCKVQTINVQPKNNQTGGDQFVIGIEQNNKQNVEKRRSSKQLIGQKKEKFPARNTKDKQVLKQNTQTVKKQIRQFLEEQNLKHENIENEGPITDFQQSNIVIEDVQYSEQTVRIDNVKLSKKFRPQRII